MIDVYTWTTGNSRKIPIFLEEAGLPYRLHMVNIRTGEQFKPEFVAICPNSKMPAIVDQDGPGGKPLSLFELGAILIYLGDKTGKLIGRMPPALSRHRMGDVPDGQRRAAVRAGQPLPQQDAGENPLRDRPLRQGSDAPLQGAGRSARRGRISSPATTRSPTSRPMSGCAIPRTRGRRSTTIPTSSAGSMRSTRGRRCSARTRGRGSRRSLSGSQESRLRRLTINVRLSQPAKSCRTLHATTRAAYERHNFLVRRGTLSPLVA